ncbi:hypothetical protein EC9_16460 [Rosistilla ulvae]|uniref:Uncharacterized protein n=1 Tax=Rosistilla ulvae TaxID=1930277 RepID=A0A517LXV9_9BACT|nr:hypothetical protein EC9_16460 [Rosistilla ulvae]
MGESLLARFAQFAQRPTPRNHLIVTRKSFFYNQANGVGTIPHRPLYPITYRFRSAPVKTDTILEAPQTSETLPQPQTLEQIIDRVAVDAQDQPQRYLDEVVVPDGGE